MGGIPSGAKRPRIDNTNEANRKRCKVTSAAEQVPQLPADVVGHIAKHLGIRAMGNAAQVCRAWRDVVEDNGLELWQSHCKRIGAHPNPNSLLSMSQELSKMNNDDECRLRIFARKTLAHIYRVAYFSKRNSVCAHCLRGHARDYQLYGVRLCVDCMKKEPFAFIRRSSAARHFRFGKTLLMDPIKPLFSMPIRGRPFGRKSDGPVYRFEDILRLSKAKFGEKFTNQRAASARHALGITKMHGEHLKDI